MNLDPKMGQDDYGRVTMQEMKGVRGDGKRKVIELMEHKKVQIGWIYKVCGDRRTLQCHGFFFFIQFS
jgi:hypothetical protein